MSVELWNAMHQRGPFQITKNHFTPPPPAPSPAPRRLKSDGVEAPHPSPMRGVFWVRTKRGWYAQKIMRGVKIKKGPFSTAEEAVAMLAHIRQYLENNT